MWKNLDRWKPNNKVVIAIAIINFAIVTRILENRQSQNQNKKVRKTKKKKSFHPVLEDQNGIRVYLHQLRNRMDFDCPEAGGGGIKITLDNI